MLLLLQLRQPLSLVLNTDRLLKTKNCQQKRNEKTTLSDPDTSHKKLSPASKFKKIVSLQQTTS